MTTNNDSLRDALRSIPFLAGLTDAECDALGKVIRQRPLNAGAVLFREGEAGDCMVMVTDGRLSVRVRGDGAEPVEIATIYPGEVVGEMACLDPGPRSATVVAARASVVFELDRTMLRAIVEHAPRVAVQVVGGVVNHLTRRVRDTNERLERELDQRGVRSDEPAGREAAPLATGAEAPQGRIDLRAVPCLKPFSNDELKVLLKAAPPRSFKPGAVLCREGDPGGSCYILVQGQVEIIRRIRGKHRVLATLDAGSVVGQLALVDRSPRSATVRVSQPTVLLELKRTVFDKMLRVAHPVGVRFQEQIAVAGIKQLRLASQRLASVLQDSAPRRPPTIIPAVEPAAPAAPPAVKANTDVLAFMQTALGEWDMSMDDLDDVSVSRPEGAPPAGTRRKEP